MPSYTSILLLYGSVLLKVATSTAYTPYSYRMLAINGKDSVANYLSRVCMPLMSNSIITSLANSPFPCEQQLYLATICQANATDEIDFLAEQECLCGGSFFEVSAGCNACLFSHGYTVETPDEASSSLSSLSAAECNPTPPLQPFSNLLPSQNITQEIQVEATETLGDDKFPNKTDVSNYFTATGRVTAGAITGSATAHLTSPIAYNTAISSTGSSTGADSSSSVASTSRNDAMGRTARFDAGMLGAGLVILALL